MSMQTNLLGRQAKGTIGEHLRGDASLTPQTTIEVTGEIVAIYNGTPPEGWTDPWWLLALRGESGRVYIDVPLTGLRVLPRGPQRSEVPAAVPTQPRRELAACVPKPRG